MQTFGYVAFLIVMAVVGVAVVWDFIESPTFTNPSVSSGYQNPAQEAREFERQIAPCLADY